MASYTLLCRQNVIFSSWEKNETNINTLRQKFLSELKWFTDIIDTLRAEDTL